PHAEASLVSPRTAEARFPAHATHEAVGADEPSSLDAAPGCLDLDASACRPAPRAGRASVPHIDAQRACPANHTLHEGRAPHSPAWPVLKSALGDHSAIDVSDADERRAAPGGDLAAHRPQGGNPARHPALAPRP